MGRVLRGYSKTSPIEYAEFQLCREMGWTFDEMERQPAWRIEQAFAFLSEESKQRERERK